MIRILLFLLFFILLGADMLGINLSLGPGLSVKNAFIYVIFFLIALETAIKGNRRFELQPVIVPYAIVFIYAAFSISFALLLLDYPNYYMRPAVISLKGGFADNLLVLLVFFYGVLTTKDALSLAKLIVWTVIIINVVTIIDTFDIPDLDLINEREDGRIGGPIGESNQYAAYLAVFLPATIGLVMIARGLLRILAVIGVAVTLLALLLTVSRGGYAGVVLGAAAAALFLREFISGKAVIITVAAISVLAVAGVALLFATGYGDTLYERTIGLSTSGDSFDVSSGRTVIWATAISKMLENPLSLFTGYGWDTYAQFRVFRFAPHNSYLGMFFELGAIGLGLILYALASVLITARRALRVADRDASIILFAFIVGMFSLLIAIFFVDISGVWLFTWAFIGTCMRLAIAPQVAPSVPAEAKSRVLSSHYRPRPS